MILISGKSPKRHSEDLFERPELLEWKTIVEHGNSVEVREAKGMIAHKKGAAKRKKKVLT